MKKIIIIGLIVLIAWLWIAGYFYTSKNNQEVTTWSEIQPIINMDEAAEKVLLDTEIQTKIKFLNKALKPNYLKISDYKEFNKLGTYEDSVKFFKIFIDYDITESSLADYDVSINKWSISIADYNSKSKLYKENLERKMRNIYYKAYGYDKLVKVGIIWYIKQDDANSFTLYELWDYIKQRFWQSTTDITILWKIEILKDYFNYQPIFFDKDTRQIKELLKSVNKDINDKKFNELYPILDKLYFEDIE